MDQPDCTSRRDGFTLTQYGPTAGEEDYGAYTHEEIKYVYIAWI